MKFDTAAEPGSNPFVLPGSGHTGREDSVLRGRFLFCGRFFLFLLHSYFTPRYCNGLFFGGVQNQCGTTPTSYVSVIIPGIVQVQRKLYCFGAWTTNDTRNAQKRREGLFVSPVNLLLRYVPSRPLLR